ncbi:hypothetical protein D3C71_1299350 [compost metagenome]
MLGSPFTALAAPASVAAVKPRAVSSAAAVKLIVLVEPEDLAVNSSLPPLFLISTKSESLTPPEVTLPSAAILEAIFAAVSPVNFPASERSKV